MSDIKELRATVEALEQRISELEDRVAEAGRRALFHAETDHPAIGQMSLADVGRALLFDPETP